MTKYEIHEEGNGKFATIEARTPEAALNKAARQYKRRAADYNGYTGPVTWRALPPEVLRTVRAVSPALVLSTFAVFPPEVIVVLPPRMPSTSTTTARIW